MTRTRTTAVAVATATLSLGSLGAVLASTGTAQAAPVNPLTVAFDGDATGAKANGYSSPDSPSMLFFDTLGSNLAVFDFGSQSHGKAIESGGDDTSALEIRLTSPTTAISMGFGNDDPTVVNASDLARLTLFRGASQVGQVDVNVNADDDMNQRISFSGRVFNRAVFQYVDGTGSPKNLIEIVDDITVNPLCTIAGNDGDNFLNGTAGNDVICGDDGDDVIKAGAGDDLVYPGRGDDQTVGGSGADTVLDGRGADTIAGGTGNDDLRSGPGNDEVEAGRGVDSILAGLGRDSLNGGKGAPDTCNGGQGRDTQVNCEIRVQIP